MNELVGVMLELTKDSQFLYGYVDENITNLKENKFEEIKKSSSNITTFLVGYKLKQDRFKSLMTKIKLNKIDEIQKPENLSSEEFMIIKNNFKESIDLVNGKILIYKQLLSTEINLANKVKSINMDGKVDFKI